jgi:hypothetical protein
VFGGAVRGGARLAAGRPARYYSEINIAGYGDNRFLKFDNDCKLFDKRSDSQTQFSTKKQDRQPAYPASHPPPTRQPIMQADDAAHPPQQP